MLPLSWERLTTFSHPLLLWDDAAKLVEGRPYLPGMERIYHNRGLALSKTRLKQEAIADYTTAIGMKPNYSYVYNDRGAMYLETQRYAEALKDFDTAVALNPVYPNPYQGRAIVYEALADRPRALENYRKSCELGQRGCAKFVELQQRVSQPGK
jgi:Tfp pilus assembly protein PilF